MLNPQSASKSPLSSRIALPLALLLAGIFGLCVAAVQPLPVAKRAESREIPVSLPAPAESGILAGETNQVEPPELATETVGLVEFCSRHVTATRSFVVFKRGTCVIVNEPCEDPMAEARKILTRCKADDARFLTERTADGDVIVAFEDPVFHRFRDSEVEKMLPWLGKAAPTLMTPEEVVSAGEGWAPPQNAKIGLLARRRMLEDATEVIPVKIIRAKERSIAVR
jgi:hypothetical protein